MNPGSFKLEGFPSDQVTWSAELMPQDKTLYSTRRFLRLSQFMADRLIIATDADVVIKRDILEALPKRFDVVLYERPDQFLVHQMVNAGFLAVAPGGKDFIDFLAAYILQFETRRTASWFIDQIAIVAARAWLTSHAPDLDIKAAPPHMMDWAVPPKPDSVILHAKGDLKYGSKLF